MTRLNLRAVDSAIIDYVFQPVCNRLVNVATPKQIALFCLTGDLASATFMFSYRYVVEHRTDVSLGILALLGPVLYALAAHSPEPNSRAGNPRRVSPASMFIRFSAWPGAIWNTFTIDGVVGFAFFVLCWAYLAYLYFEACDKPPPAERRVWRTAEVRADG